MLMQEPPPLRTPSAAVGGFPGTRGLAALPGNTTLDEERSEIVASVLDALAGNPPDPDEMAACSYLLKHLSQTAGRPGPPAA
ncbi:MAG: hypothetical protein ABSC05_13125 [Candidatus Solibacter sp.]|jgi:hypothetical protein